MSANYAKNLNGYKDQYIYHFNENGDSIRLRIWEDELDNQSSAVVQLIPTSDGGFAFLKNVPVRHIGGMTVKSVLSVTKFNQHLKYSWSETYDLNTIDSANLVWNEHGTDLAEGANGFFVTGYIKKDSVVNQMPFELDRRGFILKIDYNGQLVWMNNKKSGPFLNSAVVSGNNELLGIDNDSIFRVELSFREYHPGL